MRIGCDNMDFKFWKNKEKVCNEGAQIKTNPGNIDIDNYIKNYTAMLQTADRLQCINRYITEDLPSAFTADFIEDKLYYKTAICCILYGNDVIFTDFSTNGKLNKLGALDEIEPITFDGHSLGFKTRCYSPLGDYEYNKNCAVLIKDYSLSFGAEKGIPRCNLNLFTTIKDEVMTYKQLYINILMNVNKLLVRCENESQSKNLLKQARNLLDPTQLLIGVQNLNSFNEDFEMQKFVDKVDITGLTQAIDYYNKIRRQFNGIPAPTSFEKKQRLITDEIADVTTAGNLILYDGYMQRKIAYDRINKCFGTNIKVKINPILLNNGGVGDGQMDDELEI